MIEFRYFSPNTLDYGRRGTPLRLPTSRALGGVAHYLKLPFPALATSTLSQRIHLHLQVFLLVFVS